MKIKLITVFFIVLSFQIKAQKVYQNEVYKVSFESPEPLENYETESIFDLGYDNDNYAVDIEVIPFAEELQEIMDDLKYGTRLMATYMDFQNIEDGGKLPNIEDSYYVKTLYVEDGISIPVFVFIFLNNDLQLAYETTVYCYNLNVEEGEKIVKSFKILD